MTWSKEELLFVSLYFQLTCLYTPPQDQEIQETGCSVMVLSSSPPDSRKRGHAFRYGYDDMRGRPQSPTPRNPLTSTPALKELGLHPPQRTPQPIAVLVSDSRGKHVPGVGHLESIRGFSLGRLF